MALTASGLPYPVGTDLVKDGDNVIKALSDALELRGHGFRTLSFHNVPNFDVNGVWYMPWSTVTSTPWTELPSTVAIAKNTAAGANQVVSLGIYHPHNSITTLVLTANLGNGAIFSGSIDIDVIAVGKIN